MSDAVWNENLSMIGSVAAKVAGSMLMGKGWTEETKAEFESAYKYVGNRIIRSAFGDGNGSKPRQVMQTHAEQTVHQEFPGTTTVPQVPSERTRQRIQPDHATCNRCGALNVGWLVSKKTGKSYMVNTGTDGMATPGDFHSTTCPASS